MSAAGRTVGWLLVAVLVVVFLAGLLLMGVPYLYHRSVHVPAYPSVLSISLVKVAPFLLVAFIVALSFVFILLMMLILASRSRGSGVRGRRGDPADADIRMIQELHRGFERLDKRVEALETILLERMK